VWWIGWMRVDGWVWWWWWCCAVVVVVVVVVVGCWSWVRCFGLNWYRYKTLEVYAAAAVAAVGIAAPALVVAAANAAAATLHTPLYDSHHH